MSDTTTHLGLPYLMAAQAQKHVTLNEALRILDGLVQLSVVEARSGPPEAPAAGARYLVTSPATGLWTSWENSIALFDDNGWRRLVPQEGWLLWDAGAAMQRRFDGAAWQEVAAVSDFASGEIEALGIATGADVTNRLAVASPASLFNHAGAGHQLKINKAATGETASILFQNDWSGRAEMGLAGEDAFSFKVSADGAAWVTALRIAPVSGRVTGAGVMQSNVDATAGRLVTVGGFGLGSTAPPPLADLDAHTVQNGIYSSNSGTVLGTLPAGATVADVVLSLRPAPNQTTQILSQPNTSGHLWHRRSQSNTGWASWRRVYDTGNALGAVAQTGGMPTGAIIERGTNANGEYVRFADGTQICWHQQTTSAAGNTTWTFSAAFHASAPSAVAITPIGEGLFSRSARLVFTTSTSCAYNIVNPANARTEDGARLLAVGRWF